MNAPSVPIDLITVNYNNRSFLEEFIAGLEGQTYPKDKMRLFFVDNASRDRSLELVKGLRTSFKLEVVVNRRNEGFARANNRVFPRCTAEYIALVNNDTRLDKEWLSALVARMQADASIGAVCSKRIPQEAPRFIDPVTGEISWCSAGHCLVRRAALEKSGYFDEAFFMYGEDVDLSWRMWLRGFRCVYVPESICEHHFGKTENYRLKRLFYHARNSILLRYAYGTGRDIRSALWRWIKEALSLGLKRLQAGQAAAVLAAVICHCVKIPYFLGKKKSLQALLAQRPDAEKWIRL
ncbi:MAG TPA: glycosyltransferase family 2 protein [Candidatus Omnitrophota bacterium]|nr:glycosyltransferase family 2 protein [Candidatus Omnitrophota bacterium]HRZ14504.1 glycosyltransferase family 2 protein [Candidatus Omnitrophota bacterium]